jgi:hypothetical protein
MHSNVILAASLLATAALAKPLIVRRDGTCPPTISDPSGGPDQCFAAEVVYYSDKDCTEEIAPEPHCAYVGCDAPTASGSFFCEYAGPPDNTPYWAKLVDQNPNHPETQVVFTQDQSCPPSGPGAVFATLIKNGACVQMNKGGDVVGMSIFPNGGSGLLKRNATLSPSLKRDGVSCSGFNIESSQPSESPSQQVSDVIDCTNGSDNNACTISTTKQHTTSVTTSYSLSAGGMVGLLGEEFTFEGTFGMDYTMEETTSTQDTFTVEYGQKGYLSVYSAATLFKGTFTGCDSGNAEQPGQVLAIKKNGLTYAVINTAA